MRFRFHYYRNPNDCGIDKNKIDGMLVCRIPYYARMGEVLGLNPRWTLTPPGHGRMSAMGLIEAATAIAAGHADTVALMYANIGRSRRVGRRPDLDRGVGEGHAGIPGRHAPGVLGRVQG